jgi:hypothetical protein
MAKPMPPDSTILKGQDSDMPFHCLMVSCGIGNDYGMLKGVRSLSSAVLDLLETVGLRCQRQLHLMVGPLAIRMRDSCRL